MSPALEQEFAERGMRIILARPCGIDGRFGSCLSLSGIFRDSTEKSLVLNRFERIKRLPFSRNCAIAFSIMRSRSSLTSPSVWRTLSSAREARMACHVLKMVAPVSTAASKPSVVRSPLFRRANLRNR